MKFTLPVSESVSVAFRLIEDNSLLALVKPGVVDCDCFLVTILGTSGDAFFSAGFGALSGKGYFLGLPRPRGLTTGAVEVVTGSGLIFLTGGLVSATRL